jgi:monoamine oxidase
VAGLIAARALARGGADVDVIEARDRLGGRVWTWHEPGWPLPVELGPEFVHGEPRELLHLLKEAGLQRQAVLDRHLWQPDARGASAPQPLADFWGHVGDVSRQVDFGTADMSAEAFAERLLLEGERRAAFEIFVRGFHAAPLSDVSIQSLARDVGGAEDTRAPQQSRVVGGYAGLVEWLSRELLGGAAPCRVHLNSRALRVSWRPGHVAVDVQQGERLRSLSGSALVVALPVGVLASRASEGGIDFAPYLVSKREALWLSGMAGVTKVVLRFGSAFWRGRVDDFDLLHSPHSAFVTFWRQSSGDAHQITAWAGAPPAGGARPEGAAAVDDAVLALCQLLGVELEAARAALLGAHFHDYERDPFARGAYSYVRPGGLRAREQLASPIEGTLYFAGEATDTDEPATVAGAVRSGQRAAREILEH